MSIDLCVVSHNNIKELPRQVEKLLEDGYQYKDWHYFLADNGSTDGTAEWIDKNFDDSFGTIEFNENIGYAAAANQLAAKGTSEIIGILNADVWLTYNDVRKIQDAFNADASISILGPKQRNEDGCITHAGIEGTNTKCRPRAWKIWDPQDEYFRTQEDMVSVSGSAYFIRRNVWNILTKCPIYREMHPHAEGAFLPTPHYYEETWCSYHARAHGFRVVYDGSISIGHSWHASHELHSPQDDLFPISQKMFREICEHHGIEHD
jgi:glycosyltransferase involved in cell wall biosynthesis